VTTLDLISHEDFLLHRQEIYVDYLREQFEHYLLMMFKRGPGDSLVPLGTNALTERQEFIMLRELYTQSQQVQPGQQPPPAVAAYMADPDAQARMVELAVKFSGTSVGVS
jgi:hypothetical protein